MKRTAGKEPKEPSRDGKNPKEDKPASKEILETFSMTERRVAADLPLFLTGLLLFSYVAYRAVHLSFTHDESLTYIYGIRPGLASISPWLPFCHASSSCFGKRVQGRR